MEFEMLGNLLITTTKTINMILHTHLFLSFIAIIYVFVRVKNKVFQNYSEKEMYVATGIFIAIIPVLNLISVCALIERLLKWNK